MLWFYGHYHDYKYGYSFSAGIDFKHQSVNEVRGFFK